MANITTQTIRVDLSTGKVIPTAYTHQNDTARTLVFDMYNGGLPYTMTGNTVKFAYKSPIVNGQYTVIAGSSMASGTVSGNTVSVTLPAAYTAISGVGLLTMIITPTSGTIRPVNIKFIVQKSADGDDTIAGASDFPAALDEIAENWLDENISIQIDDTLSVSGKAADAKVTGDGISELDGKVTDLKSDLDEIRDVGYAVDNIIQGSYSVNSSAPGKWIDNSKRIRTDGLISVNKGFTLHFVPGTNSAEMLVGYFNNGTFVRETTWIKSEVILTMDGSANQLILVFKNSSNTDILPNSFDATVCIYTKISGSIRNVERELKEISGLVIEKTQLDITQRTAQFSQEKVTYWDTGAYRISYVACEPNGLYNIQKDIDTDIFDVCYVKTATIAVNDPVYGFISMNGEERSAYFMTGEDATFILIQTRNPSHDAIYKCSARFTDDINELKSTSDLLEAVASETTKGEYVETDETNIEPSLTFTTGYMAKNGSVQTSGITTLEYSNKIEVAPNDIIRSVGEGFRFVCAFNGNTAIEAKGSESTKEYIVPDGIDHVVLTRYKSDSGVAINLIETELHYINIVKPIPMGYMSESGDMSDGDVIYLLYHNVKNKNRYVFNANITTLGSIKFQKGTSDYITVSQSGLAIHNDQGTVNVAFPEGFSITHDISLVVENNESIYLSKLTVESAGNVFNADVTTTPIRFLMDTGTPSVESIGSVLTNCRFSWVSENVNAPIWIFGDSYVSWYDVRWVYYAVQDDNLKSTLLSGYAGEGSGDAMSGLKNLLKITTPKMVVWCLGMNNGDSDSAVNSSWLTNYNKLIELSEQYGFEIVLYTTPTTPTINNNFKNAIIRDSGYRYIEADLAVRIDAEGHWVGYGTEQPAISTDNVHPTEIGAKILYYRFLADLPELMSK